MNTSVKPNYIPEVRQQYEEFPYPERNPQDENTRFIISNLARMDAVNHHCFQGKQNFEHFRVLVAGGGTGDSLISWAEQLRDREGSHVVYLDMSETSAKIAKERATIRGLTNITWVTDSLLNIPNLGLESFDFIDCTGVLHHLENPQAGLNALKSVLKPTGAMNIMVYGLYGRNAIYQVQNVMRLINGLETDPHKKIANTKKVVQALPQHHWLKVSKQLGWNYADMENDAGVYDMFLHAQDKAYTIDEVHDWISSCGMRMAGEPGSRYMQTDYLPETFIKDKELLSLIKTYPIKTQRAIGELLSTKIAQHEFYAVHQDAPETVAQLTDTHLIPWAGMADLVPLAQLADIAEKHQDDFTVTFDNIAGKPVIVIPKGKIIPSLLRHIDGVRTVKDVINAVMKDKCFKDRPPAEMTILHEFEKLMLSLTRCHAGFLRHKTVSPYPTLRSIEKRLEPKE